MPSITFDARFQANPWGSYAELREEGPVHRIALPGGDLVWLVTRYADVRAAFADPRLSASKQHAGAGYRGMALPPALDANLLNMDDPDHTRLRRLVSRAFTARRVEELRGRVQEVVDERIDAIGPRGSADLVADFAAPIPFTVISELLGIPVEDRAPFRALTSEMLSPTSPDAVTGAVGGMLAGLLAVIARKRAEPGDDLLSAMIAARDDGDQLTEDELFSLAFLIILAGYETSVDLIGNGVLALLRDPSSRPDPTMLPGFIEEVLRTDGPAIMAARRFPVTDIEIGGVLVPAGEPVLLSLASAGRDPARFAAPDQLDPAREDNGHLSFGHGAHYCLGAPLARIEGQIAIGTLLRRLPDLALAGELRWRPSFRTRGLVALPVTF